MRARAPLAAAVVCVGVGYYLGGGGVPPLMDQVAAELGLGSPCAAAAPAQVRGWSDTQVRHAATIASVGREMGMPERAVVVALATAMQESGLRNLGNPAHPESLLLPNDGVGYDHDSVGLFQQRPSQGWGSVRQIMSPEYSARKFFVALRRVDGWQRMRVTVAAQRVQRSAYPEAYQKHVPAAERLANAVTC